MSAGIRDYSTIYVNGIHNGMEYAQGTATMLGAELVHNPCWLPGVIAPNYTAAPRVI